ncbi:hypothetical protein CHARACLAT_009984 [Characodon lateralis]|uniref:Chemokine interleukin-8-like domain-containing protein n=1 Tax=Characodon lateralis TaxID=208331 RepID=A0ABU7CLX7_9TELE|nr:hypothetical protein [Characodon lateralis]
MPPGRLPREVFQARPTGEVAQGTAQDTPEGLCLSAGLGTPRVPPGEAGGGVWGEGRLGVSGSGFVHPACCHEGSEKVNGKIHQCFELRPGKPCLKHFFLLDIKGRPPLCINPDSDWLRSKMKKEHLKCPPADKHTG